MIGLNDDDDDFQFPPSAGKLTDAQAFQFIDEELARQGMDDQSGKVEKTEQKKTVPSNITCLCEVCTNPEPPAGSRPIRADVRKFDFVKFIKEEPGKFDVILMDPPWQLAGQAPSRGVSLMYDQLNDRLIEEMHVDCLSRTGLLFIWVINNKFTRALDMMETWGYQYLADIAWVKRTVNRKLAKCHGYYLQHAKETCLVGYKGNLPAEVMNRVAGSDVIFSERRGQSQKPDEMYEFIERIYPDGRYLEIFGRRHNLRSVLTPSMHSVENNPRACLIVIDGWGCSGHQSVPNSDAIAAAKTPVMSSFKNSCSLLAHGRAVGLPDGLMGNSEVGHLNLGAGRVVFQDIVRIDLALESGELERNNRELSSFFDYCEAGTRRIHFVGLVSDGGVHSHLRHLKELIQITKRRFAGENVEVFVHAITDGRDTAPTSAVKFVVDDLDNFLKNESGFGKIAGVCGRYYAMDRDKRWERTELAFQALTEATGESSLDLRKTMTERYAAGETDEFFKPIICDSKAKINAEDGIIFFNFRSDRMRQICSMFLERRPQQRILTMTAYNADFPFPNLSPPQKMTNVLAEWLAKQGRTQCHIAETEKYAHVTFFFNGGREEKFAGEERVLIASPKVATYDLQPEMSVKAVAEAMAEAVRSGKFDFVMGNLAPPDMVGHTGKFEETIRAVEATDEAVGIVLKACRESGVTLFVTADHGNAEKMLAEDGQPHTAHTCAPVPFICSDESVKFTGISEASALCDVAPTLLKFMNLSIPEEMTGKALI